MSVPSVIMAQDVQHSQTETEQAQVAVVVNKSNLRVMNADGQLMKIYSITGENVYNLRIESPSKSIDLSQLPHGCYIVKIGTFTRKIYLS